MELRVATTGEASGARRMKTRDFMQVRLTTWQSVFSRIAIGRSL